MKELVISTSAEVLQHVSFVNSVLSWITHLLNLPGVLGGFLTFFILADCPITLKNSKNITVKNKVSLKSKKTIDIFIVSLCQ